MGVCVEILLVVVAVVACSSGSSSIVQLIETHIIHPHHYA